MATVNKRYFIENKELATKEYAESAFTAARTYTDNAIANIDMQYETMPVASENTLGKVVQYIGETTPLYTQGYFYLGTAEEVSGVVSYSWKEIGTQEVDLSNYLAKDNTTAFTPTGDYNPATKKYIDDTKAALETEIDTASIQKDEMPIASAENVGEIIQYIGDTTGGYEQGHFYICVEGEEVSGVVTYNWEEINVQDVPDTGKIYIINQPNFSSSFSQENWTTLNNWYQDWRAGKGPRLLLYTQPYYANLAYYEPHDIWFKPNAAVWKLGFEFQTRRTDQNYPSHFGFCVALKNQNTEINSDVGPGTGTSGGLLTTQDRVDSIENYNKQAAYVELALSTENTKAYTPTANYHPATKKYVDDSIASAMSAAIKREIVQELPVSDIKTDTIYMVPKTPGGRLPAEYQEVTYIESHGTEYINTGVEANSNIKTEVVLLNPNMSDTADHTLCGGGDTWGRDYIQLQCRLNSMCSYGDSWARVPFGGGNRITIVQDKNKFYQDGTLLSTFNIDTFTTPYSIYLFCAAQSDTPAEFSSFKVESFKLYNDDVLVRDLVPCYRKSDDEPGLYDLVNDVFYTNLGTGDFAIGDPVIGSSSSVGNDVYNEYMYINNAWELIGNTDIDLTDYVTIEDMEEYVEEHATQQNTIMPEPSADNVGEIVQYSGESDGEFTQGYFYICKETEISGVVTYYWEQVNAQPDAGKYKFFKGTQTEWDQLGSAEQQTILFAAVLPDGELVLTPEEEEDLTSSLGVDSDIEVDMSLEDALDTALDIANGN